MKWRITDLILNATKSDVLSGAQNVMKKIIVSDAKIVFSNLAGQTINKVKWIVWFLAQPRLSPTGTIRDASLATIDAVSAPQSHVVRGKLHNVTLKNRRLSASLSAPRAVIVAMGGAKSVQKDVLNAQARETVPNATKIMN